MKLNVGRYIFGVLMFFLYSQTTFAQDESLRTKIAGIIEQTQGRVGVFIEDIENKDTLTLNNNVHYPMQSVFKFPLALAVLGKVDKGIFTLNQKIHLKKKDLLPNTWSPIREKYPDGNIDIPLSELLNYTVLLSDNNGCDILFRLVGGPAKVDQFVRSLGISEMAIVANEEEMHKDWAVQYKNWTTPAAMGQLLCKFVSDSILSTTSKDYLWNVMVATTTGAKRIKGQLPAETIVAHKTGSSGVNDNGVAAATNDVGVIMLPNGHHLVIVILVSDSFDDENTRDGIISGIAKAAWDYYSTL